LENLCQSVTNGRDEGVSFGLDILTVACIESDSKILQWFDDGVHHGRSVVGQDEVSVSARLFNQQGWWGRRGRSAIRWWARASLSRGGACTGQRRRALRRPSARIKTADDDNGHHDQDGKFRRREVPCVPCPCCRREVPCVPCPCCRHDAQSLPYLAR